MNAVLPQPPTMRPRTPNNVGGFAHAGGVDSRLAVGATRRFFKENERFPPQHCMGSGGSRLHFGA